MSTSGRTGRRTADFMSPTRIILDTDMSIDTDDAGALCIANALHDLGEAEHLELVDAFVAHNLGGSEEILIIELARFRRGEGQGVQELEEAVGRGGVKLPVEGVQNLELRVAQVFHRMLKAAHVLAHLSTGWDQTQERWVQGHTDRGERSWRSSGAPGRADEAAGLHTPQSLRSR